MHARIVDAAAAPARSHYSPVEPLAACVSARLLRGHRSALATGLSCSRRRITSPVDWPMRPSLLHPERTKARCPVETRKPTRPAPAGITSSDAAPWSWSSWIAPYCYELRQPNEYGTDPALTGPAWTTWHYYRYDAPWSFVVAKSIRTPNERRSPVDVRKCVTGLNG